MKFEVGTVQEFLGLSDSEMEEIEERIKERKKMLSVRQPEYSEVEREMFVALGVGEYLKHFEAPHMYRFALEKIFINNQTGPYVESLRRGIKAFSEAKPRRMTKEFDDLLKVDQVIQTDDPDFLKKLIQWEGKSVTMKGKHREISGVLKLVNNDTIQIRPGCFTIHHLFSKAGINFTGKLYDFVKLN